MRGLVNDLPSARQLDTEGQEQLYLFSQDGVWWVNSALGRKMGWSGWLRNRKDAATPPRTGWEYQRWQRGRGGFWENDTSLLLSPGPLEPCPRVTVATGGESGRQQGEAAGVFLPVAGRMSAGRPVYRQLGGGSKYLVLRERYSVWGVGDGVADTAGYIQSGRGTNSPGHPEAGPSKRARVRGWRFSNVEQEANFLEYTKVQTMTVRKSWKEGNISVTCSRALETNSVLSVIMEPLHTATLLFAWTVRYQALLSDNF